MIEKETIELVDKATEHGVLYELVNDFRVAARRNARLSLEQKMRDDLQDVSRSLRQVLDAAAYIEEACELLDEWDIDSRKYRDALDTLWDMECEMYDLQDKAQKRIHLELYAGEEELP